MQYKSHKMLCGILVAMSLTACAANTTETVRTVHDFCLVGAPITFAEKHGTDVETSDNNFDSDATVKQVKDHDLKWDSVCKK